MHVVQSESGDYPQDSQAKDQSLFRRPPPRGCDACADTRTSLVCMHFQRNLIDS